MRRKNLRLIVVGSLLDAGAVAFFIWMWGLAPRSNDPATLMQTVGMVSGVVGGLGLVMLVVGVIGRRA